MCETNGSSHTLGSMHVQNRKKNKHITVNFKNQFSDMLIYFELGFMSQAHQAQSATSLFLYLICSDMVFYTV